MRIVSKVKKFCKNCKKHMPMSLEKMKKGVARKNTWINRQKARYQGKGNKGKYSKPPKKCVKVSKSAHFQLICFCKQKRTLTYRRTKKVEVIRVK
jgi:ribosomal protein L44E